MCSNYDLETINCPLCGSDDYHVVIEAAKELYNGMDEYFDVVECRHCKMNWTNPRPTAETIEYFYPDSAGYFSPSTEIPHPSGGKGTAMAELLVKELGYPEKVFLGRSSFFRPTAPILRRRVKLTHIPQWVENGSLLDIGCAYGRYLSGMRELGWDVHGIELNQASVSFAQDKLGLENVRQGLIDNIELPQNYFDVIQGSMVLEHFHNPLEALKNMRNAIRSDGQLILSVPDFSGLEFQIFSRNCYALHIPQHLNHFTPDTIKKMLDLSGFRVEEIVHHHVDRDWVASMDLSGGYLKSMNILKNKVIRKTIVKPMVFIQGLLGLTSRMSVYARPK